MIKVFISQPMKGKSEEEILLTRKLLTRLIQGKLSGWCEIIDSYFEDYPEAKGHKNIALKYLAKSIDKLADADLFLQLKDYDAGSQRGCMIELECAREYGLLIHCCTVNDIIECATEAEVEALLNYRNACRMKKHDLVVSKG